MSQCSQASIASTIPYELLDSEDIDFQSELLTVEQLYFQTSPELLSSFDQATDLNYESESESEESVSVGIDEVTTALCTVPVVNVDASVSDESEMTFVNDMKVKTCGCQKLYNKPCSEIVSFDKMVEFREYCRELSNNELDLVIKAELACHRSSGQETMGNRKKKKTRERSFQKYFFDGIQVCRNVFCFTHGIGKKKLANIATSLEADGLVPRVHGLTKCKANHGKGLTYIDHERIKQFIVSYGRDNALPLPGRLPNFRQSHVYVLPSDKSMSDIHCLYEVSANSMGYRSVSLRSFQRVWHDLCPHITLAKPTTDLCQTCQNYSASISQSGQLPEDEKAEILKKYSDHLTRAKCQRDYYREQVNTSKVTFSELPPQKQVGGQPPCSFQGSLHYSWDFAQQVHFPHHAQQTGPIFFKTPRKCSVFGVCSEGSGKQVFYLIDEADCSSKGANCVTSLVHHYLNNHSHGETSASFHFDNCCGQNKNNVVLWYSLWRVMNGLHEDIEYSMMVAGHTKFHPDWHFGIWKNRWRNCNVETLVEVAESVLLSSKNGHNIPQLVNDEERPVKFFDWRSFLSLMFRPLKHITHYHHFVVKATKPGFVECRQYVDSEPVTFNLLRKDAEIISSLPEESVNPGLDVDRQFYLYEHIREFCFTQGNKDITCPKPNCEKPRTKLSKVMLKKV